MNRNKTMYRAAVAGSLAASAGAAVLAAFGLTNWSLALLAVTGGGSVAATHLRGNIAAADQRARSANEATRMAGLVSAIAENRAAVDAATAELRAASAAELKAFRDASGAAADDLSRRLDDLEAVIASTEGVLLTELRSRRPAAD